jgi:hypothetical protein
LTPARAMKMTRSQTNVRLALLTAVDFATCETQLSITPPRQSAADARAYGMCAAARSSKQPAAANS